MLLSIIIPTYINKDRSIDRLLLTLKGYELQDCKENYEVIVVDDGSTCKIENKVANIKIKNLQIVRKKHKGMASAMNLGASIAKGKYVLLGIDDNVPDEFAVGNMIQNIHRFGNVMLMGREFKLMYVTWMKNIITPEYVKNVNIVAFKNEFKKELKLFPSISFLDIALHRQELFDLATLGENYKQFKDFLDDPNNAEFQWICWRPGEIVVERKMFFNIGGFDENFDPSNWYSDLEFGYRANKAGYALKYIEDVKFLHLNHEKFFSGTNDEIFCYKYMIKKHKDINLALMPFLWHARKIEDLKDMILRINNLFQCVYK